jgi:hypothetical protein
MPGTGRIVASKMADHFLCVIFVGVGEETGKVEDKTNRELGL